MDNYEYPIPQYVESGSVLINGSRTQILIWLPFLVLGLILFFISSHKMGKIFLPSLIIGLGYVLAFQKIDRETFGELIINHIRYRIKPKTLYWERQKDELY